MKPKTRRIVSTLTRKTTSWEPGQPDPVGIQAAAMWTAHAVIATAWVLVSVARVAYITGMMCGSCYYSRAHEAIADKTRRRNAERET